MCDFVLSAVHFGETGSLSCNCALTVVHIILECQQYNSVRQKYFSVTTLKELFDRVNFDDILSFLTDIHTVPYCSSFVLFHTLTLNIVLFFHF